jgi:hypothetical protein
MVLSNVMACFGATVYTHTHMFVWRLSLFDTYYMYSHGQGLLKTSDGFIYDGMWVKNAMEGRGSAIYPNGQKYEGLFSNGRREGRGTIYFTNGAVYEGRFRDDAIDGQGTMKMERTMTVPQDQTNKQQQQVEDVENQADNKASTLPLSSPPPVEQQQQPDKHDFMIPIWYQSDMTHIHAKAGFTAVGH